MIMAGSDADLAWLAGELSAIRRELLPAGESRALCLALDQGGTSSRAVLLDALGREAGVTVYEVDPMGGGPRAPSYEELVRGIARAMDEALR